MKQTVIPIHAAPDLDTAVSVAFQIVFGGVKKENIRHIFLKGENNPLAGFSNVVAIDRGRGPFDHHRRGVYKEETSSSLMAEHLGVNKDKGVKALLGLVKQSDRQGESKPFDLSHMVKSIQRNKDLTDDEKIEIDVRLAIDALEFKRRKIKRDHLFAREIIEQFLAKNKTKKIPDIFLRYLERLDNDKFQRPFDIVEILVAEREQFGKKEAVKFAMKILNFIFIDSELAYQRAKKDVENAEVNETIFGIRLVAGYSEETKFNTAARKEEKAIVIIQRKKNGQTQIFFDSREITDKLTDTIISVIRLEECLIQGRCLPEADFREPETIKEIPEWHYFKSPQIGYKKPGRFIFNGSLTAPDIPASKIPFNRLVLIVRKAILFHWNFNWRLWQAQEMAEYLKKGKET